jgi:hypothetical protein
VTDQCSWPRYGAIGLARFESCRVTARKASNMCVTPSGIVGTYSGFNDANSDGSEIVEELDVQGDFGDGTGCASKYSFEMIRQ